MPMVQDFMTRDVVKVREDAKASDAAKSMTENNVGTVVVVDRNDKLLGIITDRKLATEVLGKGRDPMSTTIYDVMTPSPVSTHADISICDVSAKMDERSIRRIPVVDEGNRVLGIISASDIAKDHARECEQCNTNVLDIMAKNV